MSFYSMRFGIVILPLALCLAIHVQGEETTTVWFYKGTDNQGEETSVASNLGVCYPFPQGFSGNTKSMQLLSTIDCDIWSKDGCTGDKVSVDKSPRLIDTQYTFS